VGSPRLTVHVDAPVAERTQSAGPGVTLPAVVQRFAAGHRLRLVIAASDLAYAGNTVAQPVTVRTSAAEPGVLRLR
jgi:predicted acyl esterase